LKIHKILVQFVSGRTFRACTDRLVFYSSFIDFFPTFAAQDTVSSWLADTRRIHPRLSGFIRGSASMRETDGVRLQTPDKSNIGGNMKVLTINLFIMLCLATASGLASADNRFDNRRDLPAAGSGEWRLGEFRGDRLGYEILYRTGRNGWRAAPGGAMAVGDGWVLGTDRHTGGYGIYRWNGRDWNRMPGTAVKIGGSYRQPWVINDRGNRYSWNGYEWRLERGDRYQDRNRNGRYRGNDDDKRDWRDGVNHRDRRNNRR
jgi:hypothetical protein